MFHDVDLHLTELLRGDPPKTRVATYVANDARIDHTKHNFANFLNVYLTVAVPPGFPDAYAWLVDWEIWRYLAHQTHHIGVGN